MQYVIDAASGGSLYAMTALGVALVFGVMRLVNFAHGELIAVAGYVILALAGVPWIAVVFAAPVAAAAAAAAMERVAFRPVRRASPTTMLVTSFAISIVVQNMLVVIEGQRPKTVDFAGGLVTPVVLGDVRVAKLHFVVIGTTAVLIALLGVGLKRTSLGRQMRAAAEDFAMARVIGISANRVIAAAFVASGVLGGVAALFLVAETGTLFPSMGVQPVLIAFVATVLGGMGSLVGAAVGGFLLGALGVALQAALPVDVRGYRDAIVFAAVIMVLLLRPKGLFASRAEFERI